MKRKQFHKEVIDDSKLIKIGYELLQQSIKKSGFMDNEPFNKDTIPGARLVTSLYNGIQNAYNTEVSIYKLTDYKDKIAIVKRYKI